MSSAEGVDALERKREAGGMERQLTPRRREARQRLRCIAGHLRGIAGMLDSGANWAEAVDQIRAVRRALKRVALLMLAEHLEGIAHLGNAESDDEAMEQALRETRFALLGVPSMKDVEWDEAPGPGLGEEKACAIV
jgi:DNA-binding FrmR family transcriptional regulator